jgi:hypothetical protein
MAMDLRGQVGANDVPGALRHLVAPTLCVVGLMLGMAPARAAVVVTDNVYSLAKHAQADTPVTFGQVFKGGDVPRGASLTATLGGQPVTLQVDPKATNPDGSLRHAVLTFEVPALAAGAKLPLVLSTGTAASGTPITVAQLLETDYDATASVYIAGTVYTANARQLLQAADTAKTCKPWNRDCNVWLSGPLASEWVVNGLVTASDGTTNPNLRIYFAIRAYAGATPGRVGLVRTDIIVENSDAFSPQAQPQYTATLTSGSAGYTSPALTQYAATRWHQVLWWNKVEPEVYLQQNTGYIQESNAVSRYMSLTPDEKFLASLRQTCAPLDHCDQTTRMGNTGAQAAIGPLPRWTSVYIVDPDIRAYRWMLANTDALGAYSIHYRDHETGFPVSIREHPYVTIANWASAHDISGQDSAKGRSYKADLLAKCVNNSVVKDCDHPWYSTGNPYTWDNAHQPAESYVTYMVTGSWYYMSELAFGASHNALFPNEGYRGQSKGLIDRAHRQIRGKAWVLREMVNAAWLLPDHYPLRPEFTASVENSLAEWNAMYSHNPAANTLGLLNDGAIYSLHNGKRNGMAPWQHNFFTWSVGHAAELSFDGAAVFRNWLAKFELGLMTDWQSNPTLGYCWLQASAYKIQVKDASGNWLPSYTAIYAATFPTLRHLTCNSPDMVAEMGKLRKKPWQIGEMSGHPHSPTGFPANLQIGVAAAADSGLPNAEAAWKIFQSRSVKPAGKNAYDEYPNFAVLPRSVQSSVQPRPVE